MIEFDVRTEARQQTSLTEWCDARQTVSQREGQKEKTPACVLQENDLLDDGGDSVFSQMVFLQFTAISGDDRAAPKSST